MNVVITMYETNKDTGVMSKPNGINQHLICV